MAELGAAVTAHASLPFPAQVVIGRALTLWFIGEAILILISLVSVNLLPRSVRTHALFALSGAVAAATPLFANAAQWVAQPFLAIFFSSPMCGAGSSRLMGDRLSSDGRCSRLARRPSAALRGGLGTLADWLHQGRDLRRAVHGPYPHRGPDPERARRGGGSRRRRAAAGSAYWRAPFSARANDRGQRRWDGAFLRPAERRLSRSARTRARACRRARPRARLSRQSGGLRRRRALSRDGCDRRARLRRRRLRLRRGERDPRRAARSCKAGGCMRSAFCSAPWSLARSAGISTRPSSMSSSTSSGPMPTSTIGSTAASSATSPPIRSSTNMARSTSARSRAASGCSGPSRWRA